MSKRFEWHSYYKRMVLDIKTNKIIKVIDTLNQQDQRIAELEEQLKNAIVPKFKIGSKVYFKKSLVYFVDGKDKIMSGVVTGFMTNKTFNWYEIDRKDTLLEPHLFATKEEAQAKLKELQGE